MVTSYGDTNFIEFQKDSGGFINKVELEMLNAKMNGVNPFTHYEEDEYDSFHAESNKNITGNKRPSLVHKSTLQKNAFPDLKDLSHAQPRPRVTTNQDYFAKIPSKHDNIQMIGQTVKNTFYTESEYTTKSQFHSFSDLVNKDEKLHRDISWYCASGDHLNLIRYKLNNNKVKSQVYMKDNLENEYLKNNFYNKIVENYNKKMDLMRSHTTIKKYVTNEQDKKMMNDKGNKENQKISEFESLFRHLDNCYSYCIENAGLGMRPDSREGHTMSL